VADDTSDLASGGSPYRAGGSGLPCPRCAAPMVRSPQRQTSCEITGCGDWWPKPALVTLIDWRAVEYAEPHLVFGVPPPAIACPECARDMIVSMRARVLFGHCNDHGVWLDRAEGQTLDAAAESWRQLLADHSKPPGRSGV
jgi:hypothetical protein